MEYKMELDGWSYNGWIWLWCSFWWDQALGLRPRVCCRRVGRQLQLCCCCMSLMSATCSSRRQGSTGFAPTSALQACCTTANAVPPVHIGDYCGMLSTTAGIQFWDRDQECAATAMSPAVLGKNVGTWVDYCPCLHAASAHSGCEGFDQLLY